MSQGVLPEDAAQPISSGRSSVVRIISRSRSEAFLNDAEYLGVFLVRSTFLCLMFSVLVATAEKPRPPAPAGPVVHLASGAVRGMLHDNISVFEGVPFASPPVGPLRWREPQPVAPWKGIRDATKPSHPCIQPLEGVDSFIAPLAATYGVTYLPQQLDPSEDCIYLNVWSAQLQPGARLPVMVWIHGGSNRVGSGAEYGYDGSSLASRGVVVVTINYRLGVMGFFAHPELTAESAHHSSGNYGILDQIAALEWVRQNISQFGGDPANVTVFGESAGSIDATTLMISPLTTGLFRRVVAESGPAFGLGPAQNLSRMEGLGKAVGKEAGGKAGAQLEALRKLTGAQIAQIEGRLIASEFKGYDPNAAIVDGWVLPRSPASAFALGQLQHVDLLVGINAREFSAFRIGAAEAAKKSQQPVVKPGLWATIKATADTARPIYGGWTDLAVATYLAKILVHGDPAVDQASNDIVGACPSGAEAALTTSAGQHAYVYRFDRSVPGKGESALGAFHSIEIPYVFGTFKARTFNWLPFTSTDQKLSQIVQGYWINFAKSGDPNGPGLAEWEAWSDEKEPFISFSQSGDAVGQKDFSPPYCHLSADRLKKQLVDY
jgi:para-nitrobenzyl esterase